MAKPAAIPDTTSAPPLLLKIAVFTVSESTHVISQKSIRAPFFNISPKRPKFTLIPFFNPTAKSGLTLIYIPTKIANSRVLAITVAKAAPLTPSAGKPKFPYIRR